MKHILKWLKSVFGLKLYTFKNAEICKVVGPEKLLDSLVGFLGFVYVHDGTAIAWAAFSQIDSSGRNSINGFSLSKVTVVPASPLIKFLITLSLG